MKGGSGDMKLKFQIKMPRNADYKYKDSWKRVATMARVTGVQEIVAYEITYPDWAALSLKDKVKELSGENAERITEFRNMCMNSRIGKRSKGMHYFSISFPEYVKILMTHDMKLLEEAMQKGGGKVCAVAFKQMSSGAFEKYLKTQGREDQAFIGGCEIMLGTVSGDVERFCYTRRKENLFNDQQIDALSKVVAGDDETIQKQAAEFLKSPDAQNFLSNPQADPLMLANIMANLSLEDPVMAEQTKKYLLISCALCGAQRTGLLTCSGCRKVKYCGRDCQVKHWKTHMQSCQEK